MLFEVQFLQRRTIVIETFDLACAEALVKRWREERREKGDEVVVLAVVPADAKAVAA